MFSLIAGKPFLVAILSGACAQFLKVATFIVAERRVNYRRFVQTDGMPNMHSAAFAGMTMAIGLRDGFASLPFAFSLCLTAVVMVDTMNVKTAASRQSEAVLLLLDRMRNRPVQGTNTKSLSYTPMDVFSGIVLGVIVAIVVV